MLIKKSEITGLSENIRKAIDGQDVDLRDNREGALSILKNDIYTLVNIQKEQKNFAQKERDRLSEYLADISHQLKTPITSAMLMANLLEDAEDDKRAEFTFNIKKELTHMEWLVTALLKMARLDSGVVDFNMVEISVAELMQTALEPLELLLDVKNQSVDIKNNVKLKCDRRWTVEALTNLLKNASECSKESSQICIDSGGNPIYSWISVTDGGDGIPKEKLSGLFRRFENSQSENGYGIGLPLALSIIRGQNGDIEVAPGGNGVGATFTIKFFK
ncbi:MAG: HAMP domain-containing histidine kinase [Lachnospiraceae bacterium]|nr:HAMP domain-containing histidine kinase [Lachnospiraceae bacterium]